MRGRYPQSLAMLTVLLATLATSALAQGTASVSATTERIQELSYQFRGSRHGDGVPDLRADHV